MTGDLETSLHNGAAGGDAPAMRFSVDGWDPTYGMSLELEDYLDESTASIEAHVEMPAEQWQPINPDPGQTPPAALLFVDGVRRIRLVSGLMTIPPAMAEQRRRARPCARLIRPALYVAATTKPTLQLWRLGAGSSPWHHMPATSLRGLESTPRAVRQQTR